MPLSVCQLCYQRSCSFAAAPRRDCFSFDKCTAAAKAAADTETAASKEERKGKGFQFKYSYSFGLIFFRFCQLDSVLEVALSWDLFQGGPLHQASIFSNVTDFGSS